jgi:hypothetical protein
MVMVRSLLLNIKPKSNQTKPSLIAAPRSTKFTMQSNVGNPQVYEAGDQRNPKASETGSGTRYHEGAPNAHLQNDSSKPTILDCTYISGNS